MRRYIAKPYGQSISGIRLISVLMAVVVLWMLYQRLKDPATWKVFLSDHVSVADDSRVVTVPEPENLVPGPDDRDETEFAAVQKLFEFVTDRSPLKSREMDAYWRLMDWSRAQPFAELEQRSQHEVPFTQFWEQPDRYRGKPIRLRLHVRRVLEYDAPENPSGITKVCEAWGWTDESRSFPYVVVFPEPPEGLPIGTDVRAEIVFAGYFLKMMTYTAFDRARGAPLLVGRIQLVTSPKLPATEPSPPWIVALVIGSGILVIAWAVWNGGRSRKATKSRSLPDELGGLKLADKDDDDGPVGFLSHEAPE